MRKSYDVLSFYVFTLVGT